MSGISNWAAPLGSSFCPIQQHLLAEAGIKKVVTAFDPDSSGNKMTQKTTDLLKDHFEVSNLYVPELYDIGDLSISRKLFKHEEYDF